MRMAMFVFVVLTVLGGITSARYFTLYNQSQEVLKMERARITAVEKQKALFVDAYQEVLNTLIITLKNYDVTLTNYEAAVLYIKNHLNVEFNPQWK